MRGLPLLLVLTTGLLLAACDAGNGPTEPPEPEGPVYDPTPLELETPAAFPIMEIPEDNPMTVEGVALGRRLFHDPILSGDNTMTCASCHRPENAFGDPDRVSVGITGATGTRNAPQLTNVGWILPRLYWDGRVESIEEQATFPVETPHEMNQDWDSLLVELSTHETYPDLFFEAFGEEVITQDLVVKAIAQFERTFISGDSKFDRWKRGEVELTPAEQRGHDLFMTEAADCFHCHGEPMFTDFDFHNIGLEASPEDRGRYDITGDVFDTGRFKTPTLRNVAVTAPFMHDGRFETLEEAVAHYNDGVQASLFADPLVRPEGLGLTDQDISDIVAFLQTLTDDAFLDNPAHRSPF